jgi:hypothetical protein
MVHITFLVCRAIIIISFSVLLQKRLVCNEMGRLSALRNTNGFRTAIHDFCDPDSGMG